MSLRHQACEVGGLISATRLALLLMVAACSTTGPSVVYSILITNPPAPYACGGQSPPSACYGQDWTANDSAAPTSWFVPVQGWQNVPAGGTWCVHPPPTEQVVQLTEGSAAGGVQIAYVAYVHLSVAAPSWTTDGSVTRVNGGFGQITVSPGPAC